MRMRHFHTAPYEEKNENKTLRIEPLKPVPCSRRYKREGPGLSPGLRKKARIELGRFEMGSLERLGDNLQQILSRLDVLSLYSCLRVNKTMLAHITSTAFRRSWRGEIGVLVGSRTRPWYLLTQATLESALFCPLNSPTRCPGVVLASAGGLLCVNMHPTDAVLELAVGNPITREWVLLPVPDWEFPALSRIGLRMEVFSGGHFKVAAYETDRWLHRVFVYDSSSASAGWGVTELHYPPLSVSKWSDYDLTHSCWRTDLIGVIGHWVDTGFNPGEFAGYQELSHPFDHGFCVWKYGSKSYFASPWLSIIGDSFSGFGVWEVDGSTGEIDLVSSKHDWHGASSPRSCSLNDDNKAFVWCNAVQGLVCFMGESPVHPAKSTTLIPICG